jgi:hypothetical protein
MFKEAKLDLIKAAKANAVDAICITTNLTRKNNGDAVMGAGIALAAAKAWPNLPAVYGDHLRSNPTGRADTLLPWQPDDKTSTIVMFPTKDHWKDKSILSLIDNSFKQLVQMADIYKWTNVCLPRPGCSLGGLNWEREVHPLATFHLDERFTVCYL